MPHIFHLENKSSTNLKELKPYNKCSLTKMGGIELEINNIKITEKNHQTLGNLKKNTSK